MRAASSMLSGPAVASDGRPTTPSTVGATYATKRSTSPASKSAPASCASLDHRLEHAERGEVLQRRVQVDAHASVTCRDRVHLGARGEPGVGRVRGRRRSGDDERQRERGVEERAVRRDAAVRVEHDPQGLVRHRLAGVPSGEAREIRDCGARAHDDSLGVGAELVHVGARGFAGDPLRRPVARGDPAVDAGRRLQQHERTSEATVHEVRCEEPARVVLRDTEADSDAALAQARDAGAAHVGVGILDRDDDTRHAGIEQRVGAGRRAAVVRARFERDVGGRAQSALPRLTKRLDLGVGPARRLGRALADDLAVAHEDAPDPGVRRRPAAGAGRERERPGHPLPVPLPGAGVHAAGSSLWSPN